MLGHQLLFAPIDEGKYAAPETGELAESSSDESDIISNQDETSGRTPASQDHAMGGMGSGSIGGDRGSFARGDMDVVEAMSRTTDRMDRATGRTDDPFEGYDKNTPRPADDVNS